MLSPQNFSYLSLVFRNFVINTSVSYKLSFLSFAERHNINTNSKNAFLFKLWDLK